MVPWEGEPIEPRRRSRRGEYQVSISWLPVATCHGTPDATRFDLREERVPDARVVAVSDESAAAVFCVGNVAGVQVERRVLRADQVRVGDRVIS